MPADGVIGPLPMSPAPAGRIESLKFWLEEPPRFWFCTN